MSISYTKSSRPIIAKWSASHFPNNLTVHRASKSRRAATFGVSHKSGFAMTAVSEDGSKQFPTEIIAQALASDKTPAVQNDARYIAHVVQAAFVTLPVRNILVLACTKSIQIYEPDGTTNLHIHMLEKTPSHAEASIYARGIAGVDQNLLCVGNHQGEILVFSIPPKGNSISHKETLPGHECGITSLVSNDQYLVSSGTNGGILVWSTVTMSQMNAIQPQDVGGITSLCMWNDCIIAAYANGMIRLFDVQNPHMVGSIAAHSRCINAIDCNDDGLVASVSDDCYVRVWKLAGDAEDLQISHECNHQIANSQLVGVKFVSLTRADIAVSAYDSPEITVLRA